jgi:hypothetical protein
MTESASVIPTWADGLSEAPAIAPGPEDVRPRFIHEAACALHLQPVVDAGRPGLSDSRAPRSHTSPMEALTQPSQYSSDCEG